MQHIPAMQISRNVSHKSATENISWKHKEKKTLYLYIYIIFQTAATGVFLAQEIKQIYFCVCQLPGLSNRRICFACTVLSLCIGSVS